MNDAPMSLKIKKDSSLPLGMTTNNKPFVISNEVRDLSQKEPYQPLVSLGTRRMRAILELILRNQREWMFGVTAGVTC